MNEWIEPGREPELREMFEDPIIRVLMASDHTDRPAIEALLRHQALRREQRVELAAA